VNVFHHHLETIEASGFRDLNFCAESLGQILIDNTIRGSKEGENVLNEVLFAISESFPVFSVLSKIDFFSGPEGSHLILVHFPDVIIFDWKDNKSIGVIFEEWFWQWALGL
jgi:hypothetical protein